MSLRSCRSLVPALATALSLSAFAFSAKGKIEPELVAGAKPGIVAMDSSAYLADKRVCSGQVVFTLTGEKRYLSVQYSDINPDSDARMDKDGTYPHVCKNTYGFFLTAPGRDGIVPVVTSTHSGVFQVDVASGNVKMLSTRWNGGEAHAGAVDLSHPRNWRDTIFATITLDGNLRIFQPETSISDQVDIRLGEVGLSQPWPENVSDVAIAVNGLNVFVVAVAESGDATSYSFRYCGKSPIKAKEGVENIAVRAVSLLKKSGIAILNRFAFSFTGRPEFKQAGNGYPNGSVKVEASYTRADGTRIAGDIVLEPAKCN